MTQSFHRFLNRFSALYRNEQGGIMILFAFGLMILLAIFLLAFDHTRTRMDQSNLGLRVTHCNRLAAKEYTKWWIANSINQSTGQYPRSELYAENITSRTDSEGAVLQKLAQFVQSCVNSDSMLRESRLDLNPISTAYAGDEEVYIEGGTARIETIGDQRCLYVEARDRRRRDFGADETPGASSAAQSCIIVPACPDCEPPTSGNGNPSVNLFLFGANTTFTEQPLNTTLFNFLVETFEAMGRLERAEDTVHGWRLKVGGAFNALVYDLGRGMISCNEFECQTYEGNGEGDLVGYDNSNDMSATSTADFHLDQTRKWELALSYFASQIRTCDADEAVWTVKSVKSGECCDGGYSTQTSGWTEYCDATPPDCPASSTGDCTNNSNEPCQEGSCGCTVETRTNDCAYPENCEPYTGSCPGGKELVGGECCECGTGGGCNPQRTYKTKYRYVWNERKTKDTYALHWYHSCPETATDDDSIYREPVEPLLIEAWYIGPDEGHILYPDYDGSPVQLEGAISDEIDGGHETHELIPGLLRENTGEAWVWACDPVLNGSFTPETYNGTEVYGQPYGGSVITTGGISPVNALCINDMGEEEPVTVGVAMRPVNATTEIFNYPAGLYRFRFSAQNLKGPMSAGVPPEPSVIPVVTVQQGGTGGQQYPNADPSPIYYCPPSLESPFPNYVTEVVEHPEIPGELVHVSDIRAEYWRDNNFVPVMDFIDTFNLESSPRPTIHGPIDSTTASVPNSLPFPNEVTLTHDEEGVLALNSTHIGTMFNMGARTVEDQGATDYRIGLEDDELAWNIRDMLNVQDAAEQVAPPILADYRRDNPGITQEIWNQILTLAANPEGTLRMFPGTIGGHAGGPCAAMKQALSIVESEFGPPEDRQIRTKLFYIDACPDLLPEWNAMTAMNGQSYFGQANCNNAEGGNQPGIIDDTNHVLDQHSCADAISANSSYVDGMEQCVRDAVEQFDRVFPITPERCPVLADHNSTRSGGMLQEYGCVLSGDDADTVADCAFKLSMMFVNDPELWDEVKTSLEHNVDASAPSGMPLE